MRMKRASRSFGDEGVVAVVVAVMLVMLLGLAAVAVDAGLLYAKRRAMQTAADAAALAGVRELPADPAAAREKADQYALVNESDASDRSFTVQSTYAADDTIVATLRDPALGMLLAKALGVASKPVEARAVAMVGSPTAYTHVMPFGIMSKEPSGTAPFGYTFNQPVTLKQPAQQGASGNFQFLSLTEPPGGHFGADDVTDALRNGGVPNDVYIDTLYNTKTGMNGKQVTKSIKQWIGADDCSFDDVVDVGDDGLVTITDKACHRVIVCPIIVDPGPPAQYNWTELNGSKPVLVIGFAYFFIDGVGTTGNDCWITGRFIRPLGAEDATSWGPIDPYGAIGYRLVE